MPVYEGLGEVVKVSDISERTFCLQCEGVSSQSAGAGNKEATENSTKG